MSDREETIRKKAYELWEAAGRPAGRQAEHWAEAERLVDARSASDAAAGVNPGELGPAQPRSSKAPARARTAAATKRAPAKPKNA